MLDEADADIRQRRQAVIHGLEVKALEVGDFPRDVKR